MDSELERYHVQLKEISVFNGTNFGSIPWYIKLEVISTFATHLFLFFIGLAFIWLFTIGFNQNAVFSIFLLIGIGSVLTGIVYLIKFYKEFLKKEWTSFHSILRRSN